MNKRQLSRTMKYNNTFIIASRAYFQQSPTCTRVNNLVNPFGVSHMAMWTNHIKMWTIGVKSHDDVNYIIDSSASGRLKEICPRGNNKVIILFPYIMINFYYSC